MPSLDSRCRSVIVVPVELTLGLDYHPHTWLSLRPEIRGDFADEGVFRGGKDHNQFTAAIDAILKF